MIHLRSVTKRPVSARKSAQFPFSVPTIKQLETITFDAPVTFLVGENGSGKSTFLESLACAVGSITVGTESVKTDPTLTAARQVAKSLKLVWNQPTKKGFFLRAEDFFGYAKSMAQTKHELETELNNIETDYEGRSEFAKSLARMPYANQLHAMSERYGEDGLDSYSHGESFLTLFQARFIPGGLYLLDEPEAPLSPLRQLSFLSLLKQMVAQNAQFIIATHSPIIMGYPEATILSFDCAPAAPVPYDDLEHVNIMRDFLNNRDQFLKHL